MGEWVLPPEHGADDADDGEGGGGGAEIPSLYRKPVAAALHLD